VTRRVAAIDSLLGIKDADSRLLQALLYDSRVARPRIARLGRLRRPPNRRHHSRLYGFLPSRREEGRPRHARLANRFREGTFGSVTAGSVVKDSPPISSAAPHASTTPASRSGGAAGASSTTPAEKQKRHRTAQTARRARGKTPDVNHGRVLYTKTACSATPLRRRRKGRPPTSRSNPRLTYLWKRRRSNAVIPNDYSRPNRPTDRPNILGIARKEDDKSVTLRRRPESHHPKSEIQTARLSKRR